MGIKEKLNENSGNYATQLLVGLENKTTQNFFYLLPAILLFCFYVSLFLDTENAENSKITAVSENYIEKYVGRQFESRDLICENKPYDQINDSKYKLSFDMDKVKGIAIANDEDNVKFGPIKENAIVLKTCQYTYHYDSDTFTVKSVEDNGEVKIINVYKNTGGSETDKLNISVKAIIYVLALLSPFLILYVFEKLSNSLKSKTFLIAMILSFVFFTSTLYTFGYNIWVEGMSFTTLLGLSYCLTLLVLNFYITLVENNVKKDEFQLLFDSTVHKLKELEEKHLHRVGNIEKELSEESQQIREDYEKKSYEKRSKRKTLEQKLEGLEYVAKIKKEECYKEFEKDTNGVFDEATKEFKALFIESVKQQRK